MPTALHLIRASEFVCVDADEHIDIEHTKKTLRDLVYACHKRGVKSAMMDLRGMPIPSKPYFTSNELAELVETFHEAGFTKNERLAILYEWDNFGGVRNFTFFSRMHKMQVQAFQDFERAIYWLSEQQDALGSSPPGTPIAIAKAKIKKSTAHTTRITRADIPRSAAKLTGRHSAKRKPNVEWNI